MLLTAVAVARLYDTPEKVPTYAEAVASDALVAINGRVEGLDTLGGIVQDEFGFMASFLMPLFGIALVVAMTRREEETGRLEQLLGGRIDRRAPAVAALLVVLGAVARHGPGIRRLARRRRHPGRAGRCCTRSPSACSRSSSRRSPRCSPR